MYEHSCACCQGGALHQNELIRELNMVSIFCILVCRMQMVRGSRARPLPCAIICLLCVVGVALYGGLGVEVSLVVLVQTLVPIQNVDVGQQPRLRRVS